MEKRPEIRSNFISSFVFIAAIANWKTLSSLYSVHNPICPEEAGSSVWSDYKDLQVSSRIFCTWTAKAFWSVVDRMGTINPIVIVPRTPAINNEQFGGQRPWYIFSTSVLRNNTTAFDCVAWNHGGYESHPFSASHVWLVLPLCLENRFFSLWCFAVTNKRQRTKAVLLFFVFVFCFLLLGKNMLHLQPCAAINAPFFGLKHITFGCLTKARDFTLPHDFVFHKTVEVHRLSFAFSDVWGIKRRRGIILLMPAPSYCSWLARDSETFPSSSHPLKSPGAMEQWQAVGMGSC